MFSYLSNPKYIDQFGLESGLDRKDEAVLDKEELYLSNEGKTNLETDFWFWFWFRRFLIYFRT